MRVRRRTLPGFLVVLALLGAACGGGGDDKADRASTRDTSKSTTTPAADGADKDDAGSASDTTKPAEGDSEAPDTTIPPADPGPGDGGGGAPTTAAANQADPQAPRPLPQPGRYTMSVKGKAEVNGESQPVPPEVAFTVEQLNKDDQRHTTHGGEGGGDTVQVLRETSSEVLLISLSTAGRKKFQPDPPVRFAPWPPTVGAEWSWTMRSTDELTTVEQSSKVVKTEPVTGPGWSADTFVVETTMTFSGDITGKVDLTSWFAPAHGLSVRQHQKSNMTFGPYKIASDTTSVAKSLTPA